MKILRLSLITVSMFSTFLLLSLPDASAVGRETGNGGDDVGLEFQSSFVSALRIIQSRDANLSLKIQELDPLKTLLGARILTVDADLNIQEGSVIQKSVAANYPDQNSILINRRRWHAISDIHVKQAIALHEVLGLKGIEGTGSYPYSAALLAYNGLTPKVILTGGVNIETGVRAKTRGFPVGSHVCSIAGYERPLMVVTTDQTGSAVSMFEIQDNDAKLEVPAYWYKAYDHVVNVGQSTFVCSPKLLSASALAKWVN